MPFTDTEHSLVRQFLGYPGVFRIYDPELDGAIDAIGNLEHEANLVRELLDDITNIKDRIRTALDNLEVVKVDTIVLGHQSQLEGLYREGNRLCGELEAKIGVPRRKDIFDPDGGIFAVSFSDNSAVGGNMLMRG